MHFRHVQKLAVANNGVFVTSGTIKRCPSLQVLNKQTSTTVITNDTTKMTKNFEITHSFNYHQESEFSSYVRSKSVPPNVKLHQLLQDFSTNVKKSCVLKLPEKKRRNTFCYPQQKRGYSTFLEKIKNFFTFKSKNDLNQSEIDGFYFKIKEDFFSPDRICKEMPEMRILKLQKDYYKKHEKLYEDKHQKDREIEDLIEKHIERQIEKEIQENLKMQEIKFEEEEIEIEEKHLKQIIPLEEVHNKVEEVKTEKTSVMYHKENKALSPNDIVLVTDKERRLIGCKYSSQIMDDADEDKKSITINLKPPQRNYQKSFNLGGEDHQFYASEKITSIRKKTTLARSIKILVSNRNQPRNNWNRFNSFEMGTKSCDEKRLKVEEDEVKVNEEKVMSFQENVVKHIESNRSQMMNNLKKISNNSLLYKSWSNKGCGNSASSLNKDGGKKDLAKLNVSELRKIEVAVDDLEEHVSRIPQMIEKVHFLPADVLEELETVEDEIKKEKEEKYNLVKLKRGKEVERVVTPIKFYEERKVKPIQLIEEERKKVKPISFDELSKIVTAKDVKKDVQFKSEETDETKPFLQFKFRDQSDKPKAIKIEIDDEKITVSKSLGNNNNNNIKVVNNNLEEKERKLSKPEKKLGNPIKTLDDVIADKKETPIQVNVNEKKDLKINEKKDLKINEKKDLKINDKINIDVKVNKETNKNVENETKLFNPISFDYKEENKKLGVKFFDPDTKIIPEEKTKKVATPEPLAYQIGGGHSLLCQIKNLQDAKMKNTMRESIRFMDQVKETLRWDFGDTYTKEVIHVNPDLKTSTTRILPHDPKTPYSQIWIKLNDFKIISVHADVRKKDCQMIRGLLKDQGKKLLSPFQNLGGLHKRDYLKIENNNDYLINKSLSSLFEVKINDKETNKEHLMIQSTKKIETLLKLFDPKPIWVDPSNSIRSFGTSGLSRSAESPGSKSSGSAGLTQMPEKKAAESTGDEKYKVRRGRGHRCPRKEVCGKDVKKKKGSCMREVFGDAYSKHRARMNPSKMKKEKKKKSEEQVGCKARKIGGEKVVEDEKGKKEREEKARAYRELVHTVWKPRKINLDDNICCKKKPKASCPENRIPPGLRRAPESADHVIKPDLCPKYQSPRYEKSSISSAKPVQTCDAKEVRREKPEKKLGEEKRIYPCICDARKTQNEND